MKINPYLSFDGECQAALKFYARCLRGTIVYSMTYDQSPMAKQVPPEWGAKIYHATLSVGDQTLGAADAPPGAYRTSGLTGSAGSPTVGSAVGAP